MWNANTALWAPDSQVVQQGVVNMSQQENIHQRSADFPPNIRQQKHFHLAWDILSRDRIMFREYKTQKEVSILLSLLWYVDSIYS